MPDDIKYEDLEFKIPVESEDYMECSDFVIHSIDSIMKNAIESKKIKSLLTPTLDLVSLWKM